MAAAHTVTPDMEPGGSRAMLAYQLREHRRYEISRDVLAALLSDESGSFYDPKTLRPAKTEKENLMLGAQLAVSWADALLAELEK
jgi:hypothetical protein